MRVIRAILTVLVILLAWGLMHCPPPAMADGPVIGRIIVEGLYHMDRDDFLDLFGVAPGRPLDRREVRAGIKRLYLTGRFHNITVMTDDSDPSLLVIQVDEKYLVDSIRVDGVKMLRVKDVLRSFRMREQDFLDESLMPRLLEALETSLEAKGFPAVRVDYETFYDGMAHTAEIVLHVSEGVPLIVEKIVIEGIGSEDEKDMVMLNLGVETGDIYNRAHVERRLEKIVEKYRRDGYLSPRITPPVFENGVLTIHVEKGKMLDVRFDGNTFFTSSRLRDELPFWDEGSVDTAAVEEAAARVVSLYHSAGFPLVQVAPVINESPDSIDVTFFLYEGPRVYVDTISIEGNTIDDESIKDILTLREGGLFNPDTIAADRRTIEEFYRALGYRNVLVSSFGYEYDSDRTEVDISIMIEEGSQTLIGGVFFIGQENVSLDEIRLAAGIEPLMPYNEISLSDARYSIISLYRKKGYLDAEVSVQRRFSMNRVFVTFAIEEGRRYYFGYTIVRGNRKVRPEVIRRELVTRRGEPFNMVLLRKNMQRLYKLGLFSNIDYRIVDDSDSIRSVVLDVTESNAGAVEFALGYGDYERYRGYIDVSYRNFFGMNRQAKVRLELSTISEKLIISAFEPWLYRFENAYSPLSLGLSLTRERRTEKNIDTGETRYKVKKYSAGGNLEMYFGKRVKGELLYSYSLVETYAVQPDIVLSRDDTGTLAISSVRPGIIYDSRDNPFDPRKGVLAGLSVEFATRYLLSETDFTKAVYEASMYQRLLSRVVLALSFRGGMAEVYGGTEELPIVERFFLGGRNTVRGYTQDSLGPVGEDGNPTGGNTFLLNNLEFRIRVGWGLGIVLFLDGGNVWADRKDIDLGDYRFGAGAGLRYSTPVGPFRLDYGYKLDREEGESAGEIHFSIGHAF